jgi:hypothetical protein
VHVRTLTFVKRRGLRQPSGALAIGAQAAGTSNEIS